MAKRAYFNSALRGPVLSVPKLSGTILHQVREASRRIEQELGYPVIVYHNPFPVLCGLGDVFFELVAYQSEAVQEESEAGDLHRAAYEYRGDWGWRFSRVKEGSLEAWFQRFEHDPLHLPFESNFQNVFLISPVLWGEEIAHHLRERACDFFGSDIIDRWVGVTRSKWLAKMERLEAMMPGIREARQRSKLLNQLELAELQALARQIKIKCEAGHYTHVVALDGSGRPIGRMLEWILDESIEILYMDPHSINSSRNLRLREQNGAWGKLVDRFAEELPELCEVIRETPDKVLFVDDQTADGFTTKAISELVWSISGSKVIHFMVMSQHGGHNTPSWFRRRDLQGIELVQNSFVAQDNPTPESLDFYGRLREHVEAWDLG